MYHDVWCSIWYRAISTSLMDLVLQQHVGTSISHNSTNRGLGGRRVYSICLTLCFCLYVACACMLNFGPHLTHVCLYVSMYRYHQRTTRIIFLDNLPNKVFAFTYMKTYCTGFCEIWGISLSLFRYSQCFFPNNARMKYRHKNTKSMLCFEMSWATDC